MSFIKFSFFQLWDNHPHLLKKTILEIHQWNSFLFQGFQNHFHKSHLSVPNLEFLLHYEVYQEGHDANHQATNTGDK
jgi:hypothetical protein